MVEIVGFTEQETALITTLIAGFERNSFRLDELVRIEKSEQPGYDGKVIPAVVEGGDRLEMTMSLSSCDPFTVAHELAHASDIAVRRQDSLANLNGGMPAPWHLAYKMSSEYYANRVACQHAGPDDIFRAFRSDAAGLLVAAAEKDWGGFLVYYSLMLGILHGIGRMDCEPLRMTTPKDAVPIRVLKGMTGFKRQATTFFDGYRR